VRKGATVARLADDLRQHAQAARSAISSLAATVRSRLSRLRASPADAARLTTLASATALLSDLTAASSPADVVGALADAELKTSSAAVGRAIASAPKLSPFLDAFSWRA